MSSKFLQFLGLTKKAGKLVEGYDNCINAIKYKNVKLLLLSNEVSDSTKTKFLNYSINHNIKVIQGISKYELGDCLGREEVNVLCVLDSSMSQKLIELNLEEKK